MPSKIIFVNGKIGGGSPPAGSAYWNHDEGSELGFVLGAKDYFGTEEVFFTAEDYSNFSSLKSRVAAGERYAKSQFDELVKDLKKESAVLHFVTHSMGAAFGEGIAHYLNRQGYTIGTLIQINTFQAAHLTTLHTASSYTIDYQNVDDPVLHNHFRSSPGRIKGADKTIIAPSGVYAGRSDTYGRRTFWDMLLNTKNARRIHRSPVTVQRSRFWEKMPVIRGEQP